MISHHGPLDLSGPRLSMGAAIAEATWLMGEAVSPEGPLGTEPVGLGKRL